MSGPLIKFLIRGILLKEIIMSIQALNGSNGNSFSVQFTDKSNSAPAPVIQNTVVTETSNPVNQSVAVQKTYSKEQVDKAVDAINKTIQAASQNLEFSVDGDTSNVVVKVVDQQTKQVLRQIPTEEALEIAKSLDKLQGLLIKQTA